MAAAVLTYHSHHCLGPEYQLNDHVALPADLVALTLAGARIVALSRIVERVACSAGARAAEDPDEAPLVALTFDDGPVYDLDDFVHPALGAQRSFVGAMGDFAQSALGVRQPELTATSFVIASPDAREVMETTYDTEYTFLGAGSLVDEWWARAGATGLLTIGNHSWDHLHPALERVAHSQQARADFSQVQTVEDADLQIRAAARYISARAGGCDVPHFAYPFGHWNAFLTTTYFPQRGAESGVVAAFTTEPRIVRGADSVWCLPRFTCGHHWKSSAELLGLLGLLAPPERR